MERAVSQRNLAGAFVGGVTGILVAGYFSPLALPFGCLIGVIIGYWYDVIVWSCISGVERTYLKILVRYHRIKQAILNPLRAMSKWRIQWKKNEDRDDNIQRLFSATWRWILFLSAWLIGRPHAIVAWYQRHPVNKIITLDICLTSVFLIASVNLSVRGITWMGRQDMTKGTLGELWGFGIVTVAFATITTVGYAIGSLFLRYPAKIAPRYRQYECYSYKGPWLYTLYRLGKLLVLQIFCFFLIVCLFLALLLGTFGLLIGMVVIAATVGLIRGVYKAATSGGYGACFSVTLTITTATGLLLYPLLTSHLLIWLVALANGTLCGLVVEPARKIISRFMERSKRVYDILSSERYDDPISVLGAILSPVGGMLERASERCFSFVFA